MFGKYLEPRKELTRFKSDPCKNDGLVCLVICHDFHGLKLSYLLIFI